MFANLSRTNVYPKNFRFFRWFSNYTKDLTKQPVVIPTTAANPDYLLQNLKNATNAQKVLELVGSHHKIMNSKQLMQALRSLFTLQKYGNSSLSTQQITHHPDFDRLCYYLKAQAGLIELNETIEALKVVSFVGVSSKSTIVQVLLQLLRHNVNDLSLQQIMFLDFLLKQFKSSPLVDGLLIALPIVFEVHLPVKMDRENIAHLAEYLQYVSKRPVSDKCIEIIINCMIKFIDTHDVLDAKIAKSIIWSICDLEEDEFYEPLLQKAINALLLNDIDKLEYLEIQTTMTKLIYKYSAKFPFYYNETFLDSCANYIVDHDCGFEEAIYTLRKFSRIYHSNDNLLNYVSTQCHKNPELLSKMSVLHMYTIAVATALTEFKPVYWDTLKEALSKTDCFANYNKRDVLWIKLAASLCALDIYKRDVLSIALDETSLKKVIKQNYLSDYENFLLINQSICTLEPDFKYLLPPKSITENIITKLKPVLDYPLEAPLQKGLGGENYVNTCMKTELGHHIDHVVVMRKGGYPVSLPKTVQYLEDIEVPFDSQMVLVLALGPLHYTLNSKRLKATSALMIKTLEAKGYTVVPICVEVWEVMADFEKIPFLMQAIRLKTQNSVRASDAGC